MKIVKGDLIEMANKGEFDVIAHGCNCFCKQKAGIAKQMSKHFITDSFPMEHFDFIGYHNKLGTTDCEKFKFENNTWIKCEFREDTTNLKELFVVNCYTQYRYGTNHSDGQYKPIDYNALALCMKKINHEFKGKKVGLPWVGCGLAGGGKEIVKAIFEKQLVDVDLTVVEL